MTEYLFLMRGGEQRIGEMTDEQRQAYMMEWMMYIGSLKQTGNFVGGAPLQNDGVVFSGVAKTEQKGMYIEGGTVGGYFLIKAENIEEASALSTTCPIFKVEGSVEIRPLQDMGM